MGQKYSVKVVENPKFWIWDPEYGFNLVLSPINVVRQTLNDFLQSPIDARHFRHGKLIFGKKSNKSTIFYAFLNKNVWKIVNLMKFFQKITFS